MKTKFHIQITKNVLREYFSEDTVKKIVLANIKQDRPKFQFGHDYIHFDSNAFPEGFEYISQQIRLLETSISDDEMEQAWHSLGRILHSWQDFYSHSNYVELWIQKTENPKPEEIDWDDQEIINSSNLQSGKNYGIIEFIALLPGISSLVKPFMPADSHAKMNLDGPNSGPAFGYAYIAAKMKTKEVVEQIIDRLMRQNIAAEKIRIFLGKEIT